MTKRWSGLVAAALCLSLAACGGGDKEAKAFDPAADAQTLLDSGAFSEALVVIDQATACELYGITESTVSSSAIYGSTGTTAEEFAIFTFSNEDDTGTALTALQTRVKDRKEALASYLPDEIPKLDAAVTETRGNSVLLVVANDYAPIETFLGK